MARKRPLGKILIVDDNEDILLSLRLLLKKHAKLVQIENDPRQIPFLVNHEKYDVILLDMNYSKDTTSGKEGFYWLRQILERDPTANVIMITAYGEVEIAVRALKEGASDFVLKPWENDKLIETIKQTLALKKGKTVTNSDPSPSKSSKNADSLSKIIGSSEPMQNLFSIIRKVAATDANILVLGENGTGKEVFARAIHDLSRRKDKVFVNVDMGSITETLFESELFGHKKGAFTDAKEDREGRFEAAHEGTLFLDEIGNLSLPLQSKLLTALQRREIIRLGTNRPISVDIRLICATNMPLVEMVSKNEFRQDLMYRINTVELHLPPLRDRTGDIPLLAEHYIKIYAKKYERNVTGLASATLKKLEKYHWPGNVRELQHAIERAVIMSDEPQLQAGDFLFLLQKNESSDWNIQDYNLEAIEKMVIQKAYQKYAGNISQMAKALGLTRASLYRRLEKHGI